MSGLWQWQNLFVRNATVNSRVSSTLLRVTLEITTVPLPYPEILTRLVAALFLSLGHRIVGLID